MMYSAEAKFLLALWLVTALAVFAQTAEDSPAVADSAASSSWARVLSSAPWSSRWGHGVEVHAGKIWILGGNSQNYTSSSLTNDVWFSTDGVTWTCATQHAGWSSRVYHAVAVFANKMWVLGGGDAAGRLSNDIWCSLDGVDWTEVQPSAEWPGRIGHKAVSFLDKLWVIGGTQQEGSMNDVWCSSDGLTWTLITEHAPWSARTGHAALVFDGALWVIGGGYRDQYLASHEFRDVWRSTDGLNWTEASSCAPWHNRSGHAAAVFENSIWILGGGYTLGSGIDEQHILLADVWRSPNGVDWLSETGAAPWRARSAHGCASFESRLWLLGGADGYTGINDVWYLSGTPAGHIETAQRGWIEESQSLSLTAVTTNLVGSISYQWTKDTAPISGATDETYHVDALSVEDSGWYGCQVTDESKAVLDLAPVLIQVFPEGSLPVGGIAGFAALAILTACCFVLFSRKRRANRSHP